MSHFLGPIAPILTDAGSVQELNPNGGAVTNQLPSLKVEGDVQRAKVHFKITDEKWDSLSTEERQEFIDGLPERGSGKKEKKFTFDLDISKLDKGIARLIGKPFAGYKDFADCVRQNQDAKDPDAYCGSIQAEVEGKKKSECGCPVEETITAKSIKKLDKSLSLLDNIQKKNLKR